jgi:hypothetical protein
VQPERSSVLVGPQGLLNRLSASLSVDPRGRLRLYNLHAGPIVGVEVLDDKGNRHVFAAFTSTSEAPRDRSKR